MSKSSNTRDICLLPLIVVVGPPCSGKTEFAKAIEQLGFYRLEWGAFLRSILHLDKTDRKSILYSITDHIAEHGRLCLVDQLIQKIQKDIDNTTIYKGVVISGARHPIELSYLLGHFRKHRVLHVYSDVNTRFSRSVKRDRRTDPVNLNGFIRNDMLEYQMGLAQVVSDLTDDIIENSGNLSNLKEKARFYVENWLGHLEGMYYESI
jgi:dephospho-CoA kinase